MSEPLVRMERINKLFGRVQALENVTFNVARQEIVGLLGDNGAGKSTLIKVLSGALQATSGDIYVRGKKIEMRSTSDAIAQGIETIYQDSALVTQLSIARNLFLGREPIKGPRFLNRMDEALMQQVARDLLKQVGIGKNIPPDTPISSLSGGNVQRAVLARELSGDVDVLIVANPCFGLDFASVAEIRSQIMDQRNRGAAVLLVSEDLDEILELADRVAVMSEGKITYVAPVAETDRTTIGHHMAGH